MLLSAPDSLLLVIDIQERLLPVMQDGEKVVRNTGILLQAAQALDLPSLVTEQYPRGLGPTVAGVKTAAGAAPIIEKMHFSAWGEPDIRRHITKIARPQVVIAGIEAHVCVLQTALGLVETGRHVAVAVDAISSRQADSVTTAQQRLLQAGVSLVTTEMCLFEWLGSAAHPQFKSLSALIK
jgi:nicotinamidase-related amidase